MHEPGVRAKVLRPSLQGLPIGDVGLCTHTSIADVESNLGEGVRAVEGVRVSTSKISQRVPSVGLEQSVARVWVSVLRGVGGADGVGT